MDSRRDSLKIIGAIGATCAFPFGAQELYGQHMHEQAGKPVTPPAAGPFTPKFLTAHELAVVSRMADLIIPPTETPGAVAAGVPQYIDSALFANPDMQARYREGVPALDQAAHKQFGKVFLNLSEPEQIELLTPICERADKLQMKGADVLFFRAVKAMTADGYYTSQIGLETELGYKGNVALASFPGCNEVHEH
ncbi:MAG: gluconate 2-dehydrogenase subunit 3 family protein [Acidobacteriota bacterium]|nr:gluconate 2-dehydrogenase subunit 3 family protein [Acidobacteriota bacterium]